MKDYKEAHKKVMDCHFGWVKEQKIFVLSIPYWIVLLQTSTTLFSIPEYFVGFDETLPSTPIFLESYGYHSNLRSQIPDIPDIILTFWTKNSRHFQCWLERKGTDFRKYKTDNNKNTFKILKNIKRKLHVYLT